MKKILYLSLSLWSLMMVQLGAEDRFDRQGFNFGLGASILGGCYKEDVIDAQGNVSGKTNRKCMGLPVPHIYVGYGLTPQFKIGVESKTFLLLGTLELKGQYYFSEAEESLYLHAEAISAYAVDWGIGKQPVAGFGLGYTSGHMEYELGIIHPSSDALFSIGLKYLF